MCISPAGFEDPIFTLFVEADGSPKPAMVFYEDDEMLIFPNIKEHTRQLQKAADKTGRNADTDGETAAMSYVHMLAIPKKRIYNAVTLTQQDVPLVQRIMVKAAEVLQESRTIDYYLRQRDLDLSEAVFDVTQLEFFLHCHPSQSVGHLHVHCCLRNLWTKNGAILAKKNMLVRHVLEVVNGSTSRRKSQGIAALAESTAAVGAPITHLALSKIIDAKEAVRKWKVANANVDGKKNACRLTMARYRSSSNGQIPAVAVPTRGATAELPSTSLSESSSFSAAGLMRPSTSSSDGFAGEYDDSNDAMDVAAAASSGGP
jgi:diadenosine tetraphosphate (Ap4A) HIT family hydrolase